MGLIKNAAASTFVIEVNDTIFHNGSNPGTGQVANVIKNSNSEVYINGNPVRKNMSLMRLALPNNSEIMVEATGPDEEEVVAAIEGMMSANRVVARKFKKKAGPFGVPGPSSAPKPPTSPPTGLETPPPSSTPKPPTGLTEPPGAPNVPKIPDGGLPRSTESEVPTDVTVDAQSGNVTIKKGPVNIRIAKYNAENPPDKVKHLSEKEQRKWVHVYNSASDNGDDEETANKKAWGSVGGKNKKTKESTHQDWIDFKANDNEPQYGDWKEEKEYSKEYHDNPFSAPSNRLVPPTFTVKATVPEYMNARNIAYVLQTSTMLDVDISGNDLTIKDVASPLSLITELTSYGIDAEVTEDLTKFDQGFEDFKLGQKVALLGDYKDMNYFYNPEVPPAQAIIVGKNGNKYLLENYWGRFEADKEELGYA